MQTDQPLFYHFNILGFLYRLCCIVTFEMLCFLGFRSYHASDLTDDGFFRLVVCIFFNTHCMCVCVFPRKQESGDGARSVDLPFVGEDEVLS